MSKFYLTKNASVKLVVDGKEFTFAPAEYFVPTSSWWGTYKADDDSEITALDSAVAAKKDIQEISEDDFNIYEIKKKKANVSINLINLPSKQQPQQVTNSGKPAQVVEEPGQGSSDRLIVETIDEALTTRPAPNRKKGK